MGESKTCIIFMGKEAAKKSGYTVIVLICFLIAGFTVYGAFPVEAENSVLHSYITLLMPGIIILNIIIALYWVFRKKIWWIINVAAILANWNYLAAVVQIRNNDTVGTSALKVATYNVRSFNNDYTGYSAQEIARLMSEENVDVFCMQEYSAGVHFNLDSLGYTFGMYFPYNSVPENKEGGTRLAVYSKYPLVKCVFVPFKNSDNCAMWCDINIKGDTIRLFNLHLQTTSLNQEMARNNRRKIDAGGTVENISKTLFANIEIRDRQAKDIAGLVKESPYPVILAGDFNSIPSTYTYHIIAGVLKDGFKSCGSGYQYTFNRIYRLLRIDYIFHSENIKGSKYYSLHEPFSDHNPVFMEFETIK